MLQTQLIPNLFDPKTYFDVDLKTGVMTNRSNVKVCTLSGFMLRGLYIGLRNETGPAWALVLRRCGETWGQRFAKRFLSEATQFYEQPLHGMAMGRFNALVAELFASSGWGRVEINYGMIGSGLILLEVHNAILGDVLHESGERVDVLLEGVFKALFTEVTGQPMDCYETQCIAQGASKCLFIVGLESRMEKVPEWLEVGTRHEEIIERLVRTPEARKQPATNGRS